MAAIVWYASAQTRLAHPSSMKLEFRTFERNAEVARSNEGDGHVQGSTRQQGSEEAEESAGATGQATVASRRNAGGACVGAGSAEEEIARMCRYPPDFFEMSMSQDPFFHQPSGTVRFWVLVDDLLVGASIGKETLHYRYRAHANDDDPLATYTANAAEIDAAVRRRVAGGSREPVMLRDPDVRAAPSLSS